jgi:hypothetical protein
MKPFKLLFLVLVLCITMEVRAQSPVQVAGEGIIECGVYLKARRENNETQSYIHASWVRGFISGYNIGTSGRPVVKIPGSDTVLAYLDKHCRDNPLDSLVMGAIALVKEAGGTRK